MARDMSSLSAVALKLPLCGHFHKHLHGGQSVHYLFIYEKYADIMGFIDRYAAN
jgi:hypothetical protein